MNRKIIFYTFAFTALLLTGCTQSQRLSEEEAKQIALSQVPGATEQNILEFHSDYDNGRYHYDGKIHYEQKEYEFEIDASNGTILEWDVDSPIF